MRERERMIYSHFKGLPVTHDYEEYIFLLKMFFLLFLEKTSFFNRQGPVL